MFILLASRWQAESCTTNHNSPIYVSYVYLFDPCIGHMKSPCHVHLSDCDILEGNTSCPVARVANEKQANDLHEPFTHTIRTNNVNEKSSLAYVYINIVWPGLTCELTDGYAWVCACLMTVRLNSDHLQIITHTQSSTKIAHVVPKGTSYANYSVYWM